MCTLPDDIAGDEFIVRVILSPYHVKKGMFLKGAAFRSKPGMDEVSVIRHSYMGSDFCKNKGREIAKGNPSATYVGLAVLSAHGIRATGSEVYDSREEYCGHAHLSHGIVLLPGEPLDAEKNLKLTERLQQLVNIANFYSDPQPDAANWSGPTLVWRCY